MRPGCAAGLGMGSRGAGWGARAGGSGREIECGMGMTFWLVRGWRDGLGEDTLGTPRNVSPMIDK